MTHIRRFIYDDDDEPKAMGSIVADVLRDTTLVLKVYTTVRNDFISAIEE